MKDDLRAVRQSPVFRRYTAIRQMVYNKRCPDYPKVGGAGIRLFWDSARDFHNYIMRHLGPPPNGFHSQLTRKDMTKDYEPGNLMWSECVKVSKRKDRTIKITYKRKTLTIKEWAELRGLNKWFIYGRYCSGYPTAQVLNYEPLNKKDRHVKTKNVSR